MYVIASHALFNTNFVIKAFNEISIAAVQLPDNSNAASKYAMVVNLNGKM